MLLLHCTQILLLELLLFLTHACLKSFYLPLRYLPFNLTFVCQVFTTAAADERKNIVLLAFQTMEKIVREYFPYITETETVTFTDCVKCLITFTNSKFNSDVSLNAIAFLRFCAFKLADGGLVSNEKNNLDESSVQVRNEDISDGQTFTDKDDNTSFWVPLLTGNLVSPLYSRREISPLERLNEKAVSLFSG